MKAVWIWLSLIVWPAWVWSAIGLGTICSCSALGVDTLSCPSCTASGTERFVSVGLKYNDDTLTVTLAQYAGVNLSLVASRTISTISAQALYALVAPATGTQTMQVNLSSNASEIGIGVVPLTGVDQTTPMGTQTNAGGSSSTASTTVTTATGEVIVDVVDGCGETLTAGANQTERWSQVSAKGSTQNGVDGGVMSWALGASSCWSIIAVPIKPAAAAVIGDYFLRRRF